MRNRSVIYPNISEFTQQDGRKKKTAKRLSVTNVTGLSLACFVANSLKIDVSYSSTKRSVQRNVKFGGSKAKAKLLSRLSHKVCRRLSSPVLLRKFTIEWGGRGIFSKSENSLFLRIKMDHC